MIRFKIYSYSNGQTQQSTHFVNMISCFNKRSFRKCKNYPFNFFILLILITFDKKMLGKLLGSIKLLKASLHVEYLRQVSQTGCPGISI